MPDTYSWVTQPPIFFLHSPQDDARMQHLATRLRRDVEGWSEGLAAPERGEEGRGVPKPTVIKNALIMCSMFAGSLPYPLTCYYSLTGRAVAMMQFNLETGYVKKIVVHPGVVFGGPIMIEFALNHMRQAGQPEVLSLHALTDEDDLLKAYTGMGFESVGEPQSMVLNPANKPAKWQLTQGGWRYVSARDMGPLFASAATPAPPVPPRRK